MLSVDGLRIYYQTLAGDVQALDGVSFKARDGEILGLAGESGSGKSTLAKGLIRLDTRMRHVEGSVELDGKVLPVWDDEAMREHRFNRVSLVPQYAMSALNPTRKIGRLVEDLIEARDLVWMPVRDKLIDRLAQVGLQSDVLERYPLELSGGMKQRLVTVVSTLLDPSLLIADEITSALDVSNQKAVSAALMAFRDQGVVKTIILITHDLAILAQIADSIMIMYAGKLVEKAKTSTIISRPAHPYTKALLASLPEVGVRYAEKRLKGIEGRPPALLSPPTGCRFRERCPLADAQCQDEPPLHQIAEGHISACWKVESSTPC